MRMKKEADAFNKQTMINELVKSKHGSLEEYVPVTLEATQKEPEFLQHLMTWNLVKGQIRDSKIALPVISLRGEAEAEFAENAVSNLVTLDPRSLVKAYRFNKKLTASGKHIVKYRSLLETGIKKYIEVREADRKWWVRTVVQHRESMKELYAVSHFKPSSFAQKILFERDYPKNSIFYAIRELKNMSAKEAAGEVLNFKIPFQIAIGALGRKKEEFTKDPAFILALMEGMSGSQLINSTKFLVSLGMENSPVLKSEYNKALERAKKDKKLSTLKAGKAIEAMEESGIYSEELKKKLSAVQEQKITDQGIEGDWLVLGDCSGSMRQAINLSIEIASYISRAVKGKVYLIFFNATPRLFDATGKTLEELKKETRHVVASGATSIGCGVKYLMDRDIVVNGIAIVSDGGDNAGPLFHLAYSDYINKMDIEPTVYFYRVSGDGDALSHNCKQSNIFLEVFDMNKVDYYSLPNIVSMMKTTRYSLIDEIMNTPLLTLEKVFAKA